MSILAWIVLGFVAGWVATLITGKREGIIANIAIGIVGAFIGGLILNLFGASGVNGFNFWSLFTAVLGSVVLLAILRAFQGRRSAV